MQTEHPQHRLAIVEGGVVTRSEVKNHDEGATANELAAHYSSWANDKPAAIWMDPRVEVRVGDRLADLTPPTVYYLGV